MHLHLHIHKHTSHHHHHNCATQFIENLILTKQQQQNNSFDFIQWKPNSKKINQKKKRKTKNKI